VAVRRVLASSIALAALSRGAVGLRGTVERFTGGLTLFGGDVRGEYWFDPRWGAALSIGYRFASTVDAALGDLSTEALHGGIGGLFAITPRDRRFGLEAVLSVDVFAVSFAPRANPGAVATSANDGSVAVTAALAGWVVFASQFRLGLEAGAAIPLRAVEATSGAENLESSKGLGLAGSIDAAVRFY
jgi:hypothetical protein